jgi:hypothetical protein
LSVSAVLNVSVNGKSASITSNRICQYYHETREYPPGAPEPGFQNWMGATWQRADQGISPEAKWPVTYTTRPSGGAITVQKANRLVFGNPILEQSHQKGMLYADLPASGLIQATCQYDKDGKCSPNTGYEDGSGIGDDWALLNCHMFDKSNDTMQATAEYRVCSAPEDCDVLFPTMARVGAIEENPSGCTIERGMRREPCYEWMGNDVSMDFMSFMDGARQPWHTLDFDYFRSFGYENRSLNK